MENIAKNLSPDRISKQWSIEFYQLRRLICHTKIDVLKPYSLALDETQLPAHFMREKHCAELNARRLAPLTLHHLIREEIRCFEKLNPYCSIQQELWKIAFPTARALSCMTGSSWDGETGDEQRIKDFVKALTELRDNPEAARITTSMQQALCVKNAEGLVLCLELAKKIVSTTWWQQCLAPYAHSVEAILEHRVNKSDDLLWQRSLYQLLFAAVEDKNLAPPTDDTARCLAGLLFLPVELRWVLQPFVFHQARIRLIDQFFAAREKNQLHQELNEKLQRWSIANALSDRHIDYILKNASLLPDTVHRRQDIATMSAESKKAILAACSPTQAASRLVIDELCRILERKEQHLLGDLARLTNAFDYRYLNSDTAHFAHGQLTGRLGWLLREAQGMVEKPEIYLMRPGRVIILEDDRNQAEFYQRFLTSNSHHTVAAEDLTTRWQDAVSRFSAGDAPEPRIVLLDINQPDAPDGGIKALEEIVQTALAIRDRRTVPLLIVIWSSSLEALAQARAFIARHPNCKDSADSMSLTERDNASVQVVVKQKSDLYLLSEIVETLTPS